MKILVALAFEGEDPQHGALEPSSVVLHFVDGTTLTLTHEQGQAHVEPGRFNAEVTP